MKFCRRKLSVAFNQLFLTIGFGWLSHPQHAGRMEHRSPWQPDWISQDILPSKVLKGAWVIFRVLLLHNKGSSLRQIARPFFSPAGSWRSTTKAAGSSATTRTCATVWRRTAWAASTPAPSATPTSAGRSAAATAAGSTMPSSPRPGRSSASSRLTFPTRTQPCRLISFLLFA